MDHPDDVTLVGLEVEAGIPQQGADELFRMGGDEPRHIDRECHLESVDDRPPGHGVQGTRDRGIRIPQHLETASRPRPKRVVRERRVADEAVGEQAVADDVPGVEAVGGHVDRADLGVRDVDPPAGPRQPALRRRQGTGGHPHRGERAVAALVVAVADGGVKPTPLGDQLVHRTGQPVAGRRNVDQLAGGVVHVGIHLFERRPSVLSEDRQPVVDVGSTSFHEERAREGDRGEIKVGGILGGFRVRQDRYPPRVDVFGGNAILLPSRSNRAGRYVRRAPSAAPTIRRGHELGEADRDLAELVLLDRFGQVDRPEIGQHDTHAISAHDVLGIGEPLICRRLTGHRRDLNRAISCREYATRTFGAKSSSRSQNLEAGERQPSRST